MNKNLSSEVERLARCLMIAIVATAGTSKLFSDGGFANYYAGLFAADLRISLPATAISFYLSMIPFIELSLAVLLCFARTRLLGLYCWFAFMLSLLLGHYVLQEWSAVNQMLDYFFPRLASSAGTIPCLRLPVST